MPNAHVGNDRRATVRGHDAASNLTAGKDRHLIKGSHMKYIIAIWLAATATMSYAACTYNTYCSGGQCVYCTTCCYGSNCTTNCF